LAGVVLSRKALLHFLNTIVGGILGVLALKLVALWMGDTVLGQVAYALGLLSVGQSVFQLGFRGAHEQRMGDGTDQADKIATYTYLQLGLSVGFVLVSLLGIGAWMVLLGKQLQSTTLLTMVIVAAYLAAQNLRQVSVNTFNGRREIARSQATTFLDDLVRFGATALAASLYAGVVRQRGPLAETLGPGWSWVEAYGPELLAATYLTGSGAAAFVGFVYMTRVCSVGRFQREILTDYWMYARSVFFASILGTLATNLDRVMLGYFWSGAEVGLYFGMDRITHIVRSLTFALGTVLIPTVSGLSSDEEEGRIAELAHKATRYTTLMALPMVAGIIVFARPLIRIILADEFLRGTTVLVVLAVWVFFVVAKQPYSSTILGMDRPDLILRLSVAVFLVNVALNLVLIPEDLQVIGVSLFGLGAMGAATATLVSEVVRFGGIHYLAGRLVSLDPQWPHLGRQLVCVAGMGGALWWISRTFLAVVRWYHLLGFGALGLAIYGGLLWVVGELDREDWAFFMDMFHPAEMLAYLRDELLGRDDDNGD
jgi:O-antigen/teichoic acid export membrane protein